MKYTPRISRLTFFSVLLILYTILAFGTFSCTGGKVVDEKAYLVVQVRDAETNAEVENIRIDLLVDGMQFVYSGNGYSEYTDIAGQAQFLALPKSNFVIEIPETDARERFDTTFVSTKLNRVGHNELIILLEKKKTVFTGIVLDDEDNMPIKDSSVEITPGNYFAKTNEMGQFTLKVAKMNTKFQYAINVTKLPAYYANSVDIGSFEVNNINDLKTIHLRRTPVWEPPPVEQSEIKIDKKRSHRKTRIG